MRPIFSASRRTVVDAKSVHDDLSRHHAGPIGDRARFHMRPGMSIYMPSAKCAITTMSLGLTRPPLARPDDVNANKSLYGNKRETPSIRCPGFPGRAGTRRGRVAYPRREHDYGRSGRRPRCAGERCTGSPSGAHATGSRGGRIPVDHARLAQHPEAQKSFRFRHPSPEPNTGGIRLTWDG